MAGGVQHPLAALPEKSPFFIESGVSSLRAEEEGMGVDLVHDQCSGQVLWLGAERLWVERLDNGRDDGVTGRMGG